MNRSSSMLVAVTGFQLLLLATICNGLYRPANTNGLHSIEIKPNEIITGDKLIFIYKRSDVDYFFEGAQATDNQNTRDLYKFASASDDDQLQLVSIHVPDDDKSLFIANELLTLSDSSTSSFEMVPIADSKTQFTLQFDGDALVTPSTRSPFSFYLKSRYPDEPAATFELAELSIEEYYNNQRENLNMTMEFIRTSNLLDKEEAYSELLGLMQQNDHLDGPDIFTFAHYVLEDLGASSDIYKALPNQIQLIGLEGKTSLTYMSYTPMKYNWASSEHENIMPYNFTRHNETGLYAITYSTRNQLSAAFKGDLLEVPSDTKEYIFQLRYYTSSSNPFVQLFTYQESLTSKSLFHPIVEKGDNDQDIYFESREDASGLPAAANFYVTGYVAK